MNTRAYNIGFATADIVAKTVKSVPHALKTLGSFIKKDALTIKDGFTSFAAGVRQATKDNVRGVSTPHDEIKDRVSEIDAAAPVMNRVKSPAEMMADEVAIALSEASTEDFATTYRNLRTSALCNAVLADIEPKTEG